MPVPVTAFVAAVCALLLLFTAIDTVRQRMRAQAAFGDAGDAKLISASRSHGNLAEHAPIVILLLAFLELSHAWHMGLMAIGALFLFGRVLHIWGLYLPVSTKPPLPRSLGVIITWLTLAVLNGWTLYLLASRNL
ncbi:MAPEG family protein [Sphingorhabdus buctiana]|uniref:MAPEG family protein n=1 Tax=Sphingorhabdus buctiana TaxID=1508805 RepID=A0ABW4M9Q4_9SPHN